MVWHDYRNQRQSNIALLFGMEMLKLNSFSYEIVKQIYDKAIIERPKDGVTQDKVLYIMRYSLEWSLRLVLNVEG